MEKTLNGEIFGSPIGPISHMTSLDEVDENVNRNSCDDFSKDLPENIGRFTSRLGLLMRRDIEQLSSTLLFHHSRKVQWDRAHKAVRVYWKNKSWGFINIYTDHSSKKWSLDSLTIWFSGRLWLDSLKSTLQLCGCSLIWVSEEWWEEVWSVPGEKKIKILATSSNPRC